MGIKHQITGKHEKEEDDDGQDERTKTKGFGTSVCKKTST